MEVEKSIYQNGNEPELLHVKFPDYQSQGEGRAPIRSPRSEWLQLAQEKARDNGIDFRAVNTKDGLTVAFLKSDDCNTLISSMAPDWHDRLMEGLKVSVSYACQHERLCESKGFKSTMAKEEIEEMGLGYNLSATDVAELLDFRQQELDELATINI